MFRLCSVNDYYQTIESYKKEYSYTLLLPIFIFLVRVAQSFVDLTDLRMSIVHWMASKLRQTFAIIRKLAYLPNHIWLSVQQWSSYKFK